MLFHMVGKSKKTITSLSLALIFYGSAIYLNLDLLKPKIEISKQDSAINFNTTFLKFFSIGNRRLVADILWIQTLLESDEEHYKANDLNGWMYVRFNNVAELDPLFYENYIWGGIYLSIIKDDRQGAANIFEKGLKIFPNDYDLNYNAGFNYYAQLGNYKRAHELFYQIQNHPKAPSFLPTLAAKIKFQTDFDYDAALAILHEQYNKMKDEYLKDKIRTNIYSLKATKDLECLNSNKTGCDLKDLDGKFYIRKNDRFETIKEFPPTLFINHPNRKGEQSSPFL